MSHHTKVVWRNSLTFEAVSDGKSHLPLVMSSSHFDETEGQNGYSPMGLVLTALAGCTAMDVVSILKKKRQDITSFEVEIEGDQDTEYPQVYRTITLVYRLMGSNLTEDAVARAIELSTTKYCPVYNTLKLTADITYRYEILNG